ncbi:MAG: hypothetical protein IPK82_26720 [Polyangiaceae bacterium]|nr:hypothetical protein [Polyangiaceae bacterium]
MRRVFLASVLTLGFWGCTGDLRVDSTSGNDESPVLGESAQAATSDDPITVSAMTAAEVAAFRQAAAAKPWPSAVSELDSKGRPALLHAMIEVRSVHQAQALEKLGIYFDTLPIFPEDWQAVTSKWPKAPVWVTSSHDGQGALVYALIPAKVYNLMRTQALAGNSQIPLVTLRSIPTLTARDTDPTRIAYDYLQEGSFVWDLPDSTDPLPTAAQLKGTHFESAIDLVDAVELISTTAKTEIAQVKSLATSPATVRASRNVNVTVKLDVMNVDPLFRLGGIESGVPHPMVQGWGARRGLAIDLAGTKITAKQSGFNSSAHLNANNTAAVSLKKNSVVTWCVKHRSNSAQVTDDFYFATKVCGVTNSTGQSSYSAAANETLTTLDARSALFATINDNQNWMRDVAQHQGKRTRVLVGPVANIFRSAGAFVSCGSYYGFIPAATFAATVGGLGLVLDAPAVIAAGLTVAILAELTLGHVDIVITDDLLKSRGIISHEYGHFGLCTLIAEKAPTRFESAWTDVILETLLPQIGGGDRGVEHEASWLNEGFADFVAAQTTGLSNYLDPENSSDLFVPLHDGSGAVIGSVPAHYCDGDSTHPIDNDCLEHNDVFPTLENASNTPQLPACSITDSTGQIGFECPQDNQDCHDAASGAYTGWLMDMFDGHPLDTLSPNQNLPNGGGIWKFVTVDPPFVISPFTGEGIFSVAHPFQLASPPQILPQPGRSQRQNDENVRLPGSALKTFITKWVARAPVLTGLKSEHVFPAWVDTMRFHGFNDAQIAHTMTPHQVEGRLECFAPELNSAFNFNQTVIAADTGDLQKPVVLRCKSPTGGTIQCNWEDISLGMTTASLNQAGDDFLVQITDVNSGALLHTMNAPYQMVVNRTFPLPSGYFGSAQVSVQTHKGTRFSSAALQTVPVAPLGCGNGVIDSGEVCDGDSASPVSCSNPACNCPGQTGCALDNDCSFDCQNLTVFCICPE